MKKQVGNNIYEKSEFAKQQEKIQQRTDVIFQNQGGGFGKKWERKPKNEAREENDGRKAKEEAKTNNNPLEK